MSNNFHLQLYRGTTQQNNAYTGPAGEITVDTTLSKLRLHDGSTAGGVEIGGMPTGSIIPYAGSTAPAGYLLCDGSAISRSTYSALFAIIGTTYGAGDGNSTFNLPTFFYRQVALNPTITIETDDTFRVKSANGNWSGILRSNSNMQYLFVSSSITAEQDIYYYAGLKTLSTLLEASYGCYMIIKY